MKPSKKCIDLVKKFEGCYLKAYKCPAKVWTIGYGHTGDVTDGMKITQEQADILLANDMTEFSIKVSNLFKKDIQQCQFDAFVSFSFNVGIGAFSKSTLLKKFRAGDIEGAAKEFARWNKGGGKVLKGLVRRRAEEAKLFLGQV